jgi:lysophospholipase L1-like esterase/esterase/lipase
MYTENRNIILILLCFLTIHISAQENLKWDDTKSKDWPAECKKVAITPTVDGKVQPSIFYQSTGEKSRPLIVSLHTWSGGYDQKDTLAWQCVKNNYNYIHPNFRGPNNTYEACGSPLVISDIDDAIDFAIQHANVDTNAIHVIGVSGGGYATLLTYMKSRHNISTFSAWASISNIEKWFYESEGRNNKYAKDIAQATTGKTFSGKNYYMDAKEAEKRSPMFMPTPVKKRTNSKLYIYEGIHDGYTGSVPITHSLNIYNKIVTDFNSTDKKALVPMEDIMEMLASQNFVAPQKGTIRNRIIHYKKTFEDKVKLTIFEGGHEMLTDMVLDHVKKGKKILAIGDSNGAFDFGWVNQLANLRFDDQVYNTAVSGNTIGFDNLNNKKLNTLRNVNSYLDEAVSQIHGLDAIVIMLGTNDCKAVFTDSLKKVPENMQTLISKIKAHPAYRKFKPAIFIVSPPPFGPEEMLLEKDHNGEQRIEKLVPEFKEIAKKEDCTFIDNYNQIKGIFKYVTIDGIHLKPEGQKLVATIIDKKIQEILK